MSSGAPPPATRVCIAISGITDSADSLAVGKTLAFTTVTFTNSKGQLAARGSHTK